MPVLVLVHPPAIACSGPVAASVVRSSAYCSPGPVTFDTLLVLPSSLPVPFCISSLKTAAISIALCSGLSAGTSPRPSICRKNRIPTAAINVFSCTVLMSAVSVRAARFVGLRDIGSEATVTVCLACSPKSMPATASTNCRCVAPSGAFTFVSGLKEAKAAIMPVPVFVH